jgi:hypothetical protein
MRDRPAVKFLLTVAAGMALAQASLFAQSPATLEYQVKAAYLLNFANFTEWLPASGSEEVEETFHICLAGGNPFGGGLRDTLKGEAVGGRPVTLDEIDRAENARRCQVLFVSGKTVSNPSEWVSAVEKLPVLTVGESESFLRRGGMVAFIIEQGHVRFDVNRRVAEAHGLKFSPRLLRVARTVIER